MQTTVYTHTVNDINKYVVIFIGSLHYGMHSLPYPNTWNKCDWDNNSWPGDAWATAYV